MAEEQLKSENTTKEEKELLKQEDKINIAKKIVSACMSFMKIAFSKGDTNTVWYKKGLYYVAGIILALIVYAFSNYGIEIIDWATNIIMNLF